MTDNTQSPVQSPVSVQALHPRSLKFLSHSLQGLVRGRLWLQVVIGMVLGLLTGVALGPSVGWVDHRVAVTLSSWLALPGQLFLAQVFAVDVGFGGLLLIVVTAVGASIGTPATPGVGIVILAMVLGSVGVPAAGIALIMGVDRILDMSRTAVNVCGDLVAAVLMDRWIGGPRSLRAELRQERALEKERAASGADVIVQEP